MLSATALDERVTVLEESSTTDAYGEAETEWTVAQEIWADVQVRSGSERRIASQPEEQAAVLVTARKAAVEGVTRDDRLRYNGNDLRVHARREVGPRNRFVELETTRTR